MEPDSGFCEAVGYFIPPIFSHVPSARRICSGLTTHCICFLSASSITTCVITPGLLRDNTILI